MTLIFLVMIHNGYPFCLKDVFITDSVIESNNVKIYRGTQFINFCWYRGAPPNVCKKNYEM